MAVPRYEDRVHSGVGQSSAFICSSLALFGLEHQAEFTRLCTFERIGFARSFRSDALVCMTTPGSGIAVCLCCTSEVVERSMRRADIEPGQTCINWPETARVHDGYASTATCLCGLLLPRISNIRFANQKRTRHLAAHEQRPLLDDHGSRPCRPHDPLRPLARRPAGKVDAGRQRRENPLPARAEAVPRLPARDAHRRLGRHLARDGAPHRHDCAGTAPRSSPRSRSCAPGSTTAARSASWRSSGCLRPPASRPRRRRFRPRRSRPSSPPRRR